MGCVVYLTAWCNLLDSLTLHGIALLHPADCASVKLDCLQTLSFIEEQIAVEHMDSNLIHYSRN